MLVNNSAADENLREEEASEADEVETQETPESAEIGQKPITLTDIYGDKYKLHGQLTNGCLSVGRTGSRTPWTLLAIPEYPGTDCAELSDVYTLVCDEGHGDERPVKEILLPASEITGDDPHYRGVLLSCDLSACIRSDQWHPDWLSSDAPWSMLARVADGVRIAVEQGIYPFKLTRDRIFVEESADRIHLAVARANRVTEQMRQDPWLAAVLPPEMNDPFQENVGKEQTAYALAALVLSLLRDWKPGAAEAAPNKADADGRYPAVEALPELFPLRDELVKILNDSFSNASEDRPSIAGWRDQLERCAEEMKRRLGSEKPDDGDEEKIDDFAVQDDRFSEVISQGGDAWLLAITGQQVREARMRFKAYQLPNNAWQLWNAQLDTLTPMQRRQFAVLRFPVDCVQFDGARYVLFEDRTPAQASAFRWNDFSDETRLQGDLAGALWLVAALIEDLERARAMGVSIGVLSKRQLVNLPEAAVPLCGLNVNGRAAMPPVRVMKPFLSNLMGTTRMSPELNSLEARAEQGNVPADLWVRTLRYAADNMQTCPNCGQLLLPGALCPDCGYAALPFMVQRDVEPHKERMVLSADGNDIALSSLYPGEADEPVLRFFWESTQKCFTLVNRSGNDWNYIAGGQKKVLKSQDSLQLIPGTRLSILPRRLEIKYDWPE